MLGYVAIPHLSTTALLDFYLKTGWSKAIFIFGGMVLAWLIGWGFGWVSLWFCTTHLAMAIGWMWLIPFLWSWRGAFVKHTMHPVTALFILCLWIGDTGAMIFTS